MRCKKWATAFLGAVLFVHMLACPASAQEAAGGTGTQQKLSVAVLNFETSKNQPASLGENVPDLLTAFLSMDDRLQIVERAQIEKIVEEMALGKTGIVDANQAARIGYMLGAQFIITGRIFVAGDKLFVVSKVMSTETSKVSAQMVKATAKTELDEVAMELSEKVSSLLSQKGTSMLPKVLAKEEVIAQLKTELAGKTLPSIAVKIFESHVGRLTIDPAAETEVNYILKACGAELISTEKLKINDWVADFLKETGKQVPTALHKANIVIIGEGFSEFAARTGKLISVKARLELKAIDVKTGQILAVGRNMTTAVDLAENIAGKAALQKAAANISANLIPQALETYEKVRKEEMNAPVN